MKDLQGIQLPWHYQLDSNKMQRHCKQFLQYVLPHSDMLFDLKKISPLPSQSKAKKCLLIKGRALKKLTELIYLKKNKPISKAR